MVQFTPASAVVGGSLIGIAAVLLLWLNGRIAGVSEILGHALSGPERSWRLLFLLGLVLGGGVHLMFGGNVPQAREGMPAGLLLLAGLLVGYGTTLGNGCTSGHGVSGLARLSPRSLVATLTFLWFAIVSTWVLGYSVGVAA